MFLSKSKSIFSGIINHNVKNASGHKHIRSLMSLPSENPLHRCLDIDTIDKNLFVAKPETLWKPPGARAVFGGQVLGQALVAATRALYDCPYGPSASFSSSSEDEERAGGLRVHSTHCYFLRPGDPKVPIVYKVNRTRDGKSFASRSVVATQNGVPIFQCMASFHVQEDPEYIAPDHQDPIVDKVPDPENLESMKDMMHRLLDDPRLPEKAVPGIKRALGSPFPLDVRYVEPVDLFDSTPGIPYNAVWVRVLADVGSSMHLHRCLAAFASDYSLCTTSLLAMGVRFPSPRIGILTSLDHAMYFHNDFKADEWMLYEMNSPRGTNGIGLNVGKLWTRDGVLAATAVQEALCRLKK